MQQSMQTMSVTVPPGVEGGQAITVNVNGQDMAVDVPAGLGPGDSCVPLESPRELPTNPRPYVPARPPLDGVTRAWACAGSNS